MMKMMMMIWWMFVPFKWTSQYPFPLKVAGKFPFTPTYKYNVASLPVPICLPTYYNSSEIRKCSTSKFIGSWLLGERGLFGTGAGITFFSISGKWKPTAEDSLFLARNWILKFWNGGRVEDSSNAILAVEELAAKRPISLWATDFQRNPVKKQKCANFWLIFQSLSKITK